jgi:hypothetical protein
MVRYCLYVDHPLANKPDHSNAIIVTSLSFTTLNVSEILVLVIVLYLAGLWCDRQTDMFNINTDDVRKTFNSSLTYILYILFTKARWLKIKVAWVNGIMYMIWFVCKWMVYIEAVAHHVRNNSLSYIRYSNLYFVSYLPGAGLT